MLWITHKASVIVHRLTFAEFCRFYGSDEGREDFALDVDFIFHFASPTSPVDYLLNRIPTLKVGSHGTHNTQLDPERREMFVKRYTEERKKIEETLRKETEEKRGPRLEELRDRLKAEFSAPAAR